MSVYCINRYDVIRISLHKQKLKLPLKVIHIIPPTSLIKGNNYAKSKSCLIITENKCVKFQFIFFSSCGQLTSKNLTKNFQMEKGA